VSRPTPLTARQEAEAIAFATSNVTGRNLMVRARNLTPEHQWARRLAAYLISKDTSLSRSEIATMLHYKSQASIIWAVRAIDNKIEEGHIQTISAIEQINDEVNVDRVRRITLNSKCFIELEEHLMNIAHSASAAAAVVRQISKETPWPKQS